MGRSDASRVADCCRCESSALGAAEIIKETGSDDPGKQVMARNGWQLGEISPDLRMTGETTIAISQFENWDSTSAVGAQALFVALPKSASESKVNDWAFYARGVNAARTDPRDASWGDLLFGAIVEGYLRVDFARVQMLVLTVTLVSVYASQVEKLSGAEAAGGFTYPQISNEFIGLLALSSVGYIGGKLIGVRAAKNG